MLGWTVLPRQGLSRLEGASDDCRRLDRSSGPRSGEIFPERSPAAPISFREEISHPIDKERLINYGFLGKRLALVLSASPAEGLKGTKSGGGQS